MRQISQSSPSFQRRALGEMELRMFPDREQWSTDKTELYVWGEKEDLIGPTARRLLWLLIERPGVIIRYPQLLPVLWKKPATLEKGIHSITGQAHLLNEMFKDSELSLRVVASNETGLALCEIA